MALDHSRLFSFNGAHTVDFRSMSVFAAASMLLSSAFHGLPLKYIVKISTTNGICMLACKQIFRVESHRRPPWHSYDYRRFAQPITARHCSPLNNRTRHGAMTYMRRPLAYKTPVGVARTTHCSLLHYVRTSSPHPRARPRCLHPASARIALGTYNKEHLPFPSCCQRKL